MSSLNRALGCSRRAALVAGLAAALAGCGFTPIAAPVSTKSGSDDAIHLARVAVNSDDRRFQYYLERALNQRVVVTPDSSVRLTMDASIQQQGLAIEQNDTVTRLNLTATTRYQLTPAIGDPIAAGQVRSVTAVNATTELYATQVSREEAVKRLAEETARRMLTILQVENSRSDSRI